MADEGLIGPEQGCLIVEFGDTQIGTMSWVRVVYGPPKWSCWNIGASLLPEHRGMGLGTLAQSKLVDYLFEVDPTQRIEAHTDVDNIAEQRSLEKIGFIREGLLRSVQFRAGQWHDVFLYSVLRNENIVFDETG